MNVSCNWSVRDNENIANIISIAEMPNTFSSNINIIVDRKDCSDPCEVTIAFETAVKINSIHWISAARICEVYVVEHGKVKPSYLGTKRCIMSDEKIAIDSMSIQMYTGTMDLPSYELIDCVKIRYLSIKEKVFVLLRGITCIGKQTIINSGSSAPVEESSERLHVPKPLLPEDSISSALQASFAQQVLFEGKMKSLEERLGLQMERLVTTLTLSYQKQFDILNERMNTMEDILVNLVDKVKELEDQIQSKAYFVCSSNRLCNKL